MHATPTLHTHTIKAYQSITSTKANSDPQTLYEASQTKTATHNHTFLARLGHDK